LRGRIRRARGDPDGAFEDAKNALELARRGTDPQLRGPVYVFAARSLLEVGDRAEADAVIRELDVVDSAQQVLPLSASSVDLPFVLLELDRAGDLSDAAARLASTTPWVDAALAYVRSEFVQAADGYREIGSLVDEAQARLRAADQLVSAGRRGEADVQLQLALPFWRSVSATRYVREGEALLAASA
jgi:hypothetical protein